jgi:hypothetical protein
MSVENKIKQLLERASGAKQLDEASETVVADSKPTVNTAKDNSKSGQGSGQGDTSMPRQGSSKDADMEEVMDATGKNSASAKASKEVNPLPMKGDAKSVKTQAMEETEEDGDTIAEKMHDEEDKEEMHRMPNGKMMKNSDMKKKMKEDLDAIFGEDLSEEFRTKATSIFEAAVIARVNDEMEKVTSRLEEQTAEQLVEFKEALVEKVDGYLNYVVEQYMEENKLAVESGLRTEIAEDFIQGMKTLFKEHFIEVPEEKYDVLDELQAKTEGLQSELDESITRSIELAKELNALKASSILDEQTKDLAATEAEKLKKLVEGVDFDSEDLYREKVSVIKENYFPKTPKQSPEKMLVEESGTNPTAFIDTNSMMSRYVDTLSRSVKTR